MAQAFRRGGKNAQILRMTALVLFIALGQIACTGRPGSAVEAVLVSGQAAEKAKSGDYSGAAEATTRAIDLWPQNAWLYARRGEYRYQLRDYAGAVTDLDQALQLSDKVTTAYELRGRSRLALHDYAGAVADLDQALQYYPDAPHLYLSRGVARAGMEDLEGASADFTRVLELIPSGDNLAAMPYELRGRVRAGLGDIPGAMEDWQAASALYLQAGKAGQHQRVQKLLSRYAS
jgi:tetratricopeptide (TPR) repeat protein